MLIATITPVLATLSTPSWIACGEAALLALLLIRCLGKVRSSTLWAPCIWALISTVCLTLVAISEQHTGSGIGWSALRFATIASTLCPSMAVLGAKRPQNHGWQWIVLTLWIVVVWPAAQAVLTPAGIHLELYVVWKLFLIGLLAMGLFNYLPTRYWPSACIFAAGQAILLDDYLWQWNVIDPQWALVIGLGCFLLAAIVASIRHRKKKTDESSTLDDFDQQWTRFRDAYGALWALRILARLNQTAELKNWPMQLTWLGFTRSEDKPTTEQLEELQQAMATLLRRFL